MAMTSLDGDFKVECKCSVPSTLLCGIDISDTGMCKGLQCFAAVSPPPGAPHPSAARSSASTGAPTAADCGAVQILSVFCVEQLMFGPAMRTAYALLLSRQDHACTCSPASTCFGASTWRYRRFTSCMPTIFSRVPCMHQNSLKPYIMSQARLALIIRTGHGC